MFPEPPRPLDMNCFWSTLRRSAGTSECSRLFPAATLDACCRSRVKATDGSSDRSPLVQTCKRRMLPEPPRPDEIYEHDEQLAKKKKKGLHNIRRTSESRFGLVGDKRSGETTLTTT